MGRSRKAVDGVKGKKLAGAVYDPSAFYPAGYVSTSGYKEDQQRINRFYARVLEQISLATGGDPQRVIGDAAESSKETIAAWKDALAYGRGMVKITNGVAVRIPPSKAMRRVHPGNGAKGKQRAGAGVVADRPKKARGVDTRGSGKGRGKHRGAAK